MIRGRAQISPKFCTTTFVHGPYLLSGISPFLLSVDVLNGRTSRILNQILQYCQAYEAQR